MTYLACHSPNLFPQYKNEEREHAHDNAGWDNGDVAILWNRKAYIAWADIA